jgi:hypothetical protein
MAKLLPAGDLLRIAEAATRKLTTGERRKVLVFLEETGREPNKPKKNIYELADLFKVSVGTIREDRKRLTSLYAQSLTPAHATTFVAEYLREINGLITTCRTALNTDSCDPGTLAERAYVETMMKLLKEKFSALQEIGVVKKSLGELNVIEEVWCATVSSDGECGVHRETPGNIDPQEKV